MDLDIDCLREAKVENVERLAHALGVKLPEHKRHDRRAYNRELIRMVMQGIRRDAERSRGRRFFGRS
ncbi:hypothetical protein [Sorangium sp. So ce590]|uniref:hypothetical protein n=1 Tax=unclassified Sorangium TaxID=2621164 RepID=UPI003F5ECB3A